MDSVNGILRKIQAKLSFVGWQSFPAFATRKVRQFPVVCFGLISDFSHWKTSLTASIPLSARRGLVGTHLLLVYSVDCAGSMPVSSLF